MGISRVACTIALNIFYSVLSTIISYTFVFTGLMPVDIIHFYKKWYYYSNSLLIIVGLLMYRYKLICIIDLCYYYTNAS